MENKRKSSRKRKTKDDDFSDETSDDEDFVPTTTRKKRLRPKPNSKFVLNGANNDDGEVTYEEDISSDGDDISKCAECSGPINFQKSSHISCHKCSRTIHRACSKSLLGPCPTCLTMPKHSPKEVFVVSDTDNTEQGVVASCVKSEQRVKSEQQEKETKFCRSLWHCKNCSRLDSKGLLQAKLENMSSIYEPEVRNKFLESGSFTYKGVTISRGSNAKKARMAPKNVSARNAKRRNLPKAKIKPRKPKMPFKITGKTVVFHVSESMPTTTCKTETKTMGQSMTTDVIDLSEEDEVQILDVQDSKFAPAPFPSVRNTATSQTDSPIASKPNVASSGAPIAPSNDPITSSSAPTSSSTLSSGVQSSSDRLSTPTATPPRTSSPFRTPSRLNLTFNREPAMSPISNVSGVKKTPIISPRRTDLPSSLYQARPKSNLLSLFENENVQNVEDNNVNNAEQDVIEIEQNENPAKRVVKVLVDSAGLETLKSLGFEILD